MAEDGSSRDATTRLYEVLVDDDEVRGTGEMDRDVAAAVPANALRIVSALTLQKIGDRIADPKTVLTWLLSSLGAPAAVSGLLVPVRESGSLLLQSVLVGWVKQRRLRKRVWMVGGIGQALSVAAMAGSAATLEGTAAGLAILIALGAFAVSRSLASLAYKDVLGRTIPKGQRGQVSGIASMTSGVVAIGAGLGLRALGADAGASVLAVALVVAAALWALAVLVFSRVDEPPGEVAADRGNGLKETWALLRDDRPFRRFVVTRSLLLVSALSPPFVVVLAQSDDDAIAGLGGFVIAQGLASLIGGRLWGGAADRSSRRTMMAAAAAAAAVTVAYVAVEALSGLALVHLAAYFLLALTHEGARLGRKTYVTDMAEGNQRTSYVAAANSAMGVVLLAAGAFTAALGALSPQVALLALATGGAAAVAAGRTLPEV